MPAAIRRIDLSDVRALAVAAQRLDLPNPEPGISSMKNVLRSIRCVQIDPINVVTRSHRLVLFSRLGAFAEDDLDELRYRQRWLFEYWAHAASLVLTEDFPVHRVLMRTYPSTTTLTGRRTREFLEANRALGSAILRRLRRDGPLPARAFSDIADRPWRSGGWWDERNVDRMLDILWTQGRIMVAERSGNQRLWDLAERVIPEWAPRDPLREPAKVKRAASLSLRALGVGSEKHIAAHFVRYRYPGLEKALAQLIKEGTIEPVEVAGHAGVLKVRFYIHSDHLELLDRIEAGDRRDPRATVLSPFDNLIADRERSLQLFGFHYRIEIYTPKAKRRFGYYVLPVLAGDRLIGRVDAAMDRPRRTLRIPAVHAEEPADRADAPAMAAAAADLATFLGADRIETGDAPAPWRRALSF